MRGAGSGFIGYMRREGCRVWGGEAAQRVRREGGKGQAICSTWALPPWFAVLSSLHALVAVASLSASTTLCDTASDGGVPHEMACAADASFAEDVR